MERVNVAQTSDPMKMQGVKVGDAPPKVTETKTERKRQANVSRAHILAMLINAGQCNFGSYGNPAPVPRLAGSKKREKKPSKPFIDFGSLRGERRKALRANSSI